MLSLVILQVGVFLVVDSVQAAFERVHEGAHSYPRLFGAHKCVVTWIQKTKNVKSNMYLVSIMSKTMPIVVAAHSSSRHTGDVKGLASHMCFTDEVEASAIDGAAGRGISACSYTTAVIAMNVNCIMIRVLGEGLGFRKNSCDCASFRLRAKVED